MREVMLRIVSPKKSHKGRYSSLARCGSAGGSSEGAGMASWRRSHAWIGGVRLASSVPAVGLGGGEECPQCGQRRLSIVKIRLGERARAVSRSSVTDKLRHYASSAPPRTFSSTLITAPGSLQEACIASSHFAMGSNSNKQVKYIECAAIRYHRCLDLSQGLRGTFPFSAISSQIRHVSKTTPRNLFRSAKWNSIVW